MADNVSSVLHHFDALQKSVQEPMLQLHLCSQRKSDLGKEGIIFLKLLDENITDRQLKHPVYRCKEDYSAWKAFAVMNSLTWHVAMSG